MATIRTPRRQRQVAAARRRRVNSRLRMLVTSRRAFRRSRWRFAGVRIRRRRRRWSPSLRALVYHAQALVAYVRAYETLLHAAAVGDALDETTLQTLVLLEDDRRLELAVRRWF